MEYHRPPARTSFYASSETEVGSLGTIPRILIVWKSAKDYVRSCLPVQGIGRAFSREPSEKYDPTWLEPTLLTMEESKLCYCTDLSIASGAESVPNYAAGSWRIESLRHYPAQPLIALTVQSTMLSVLIEADEALLSAG